MARRMVWVAHIHSWGCSDCAWVFLRSGPPRGNTIDEMKQNFEAKRDKEFKSHVCVKQSSARARENRFPKKTD
jgi:hypothetical protein